MIHGVLLDLSGVVYVGDTALPGAINAVVRLRKTGLPLRFLTNTTSKSKRAILEDLRGMGLSCPDAELTTPAQVAHDLLAKGNMSAHLLISPNLAEDFANIPTEGNDAVVVGDAGRGFTYAALNEAFWALCDGADFYALAANRTFLDSDGKRSLDAGAFVAALEYATQRKATILGKPSPNLFQAALSSMGCKAEDAVMIGDDAEADVSGALAAGIGTGLLVRTGKYITGDERRVDPAPNAVVDNLEAAVEWILLRRINRGGSNR
ncbi:MAG: TIGR01458 family HAD-type hydrolase [Rhizobiaceae bacterium]